MVSFEQRVTLGLDASALEINRAPSYDNFFNRSAATQKSLPVISVLDRKLRIAANLVDPLDPVLGVDPDKLYDTAFYIGTIVGVQVVAHGFGRQEMAALVKDFPDFSLPVEASRRKPVDDDAILTVNGLAQKVKEDGMRGFCDYAVQATDLTERIALEMEDACTQPYVQAGLGYLLIRTKNVWDTNERSRMEKELMSLEKTSELKIPSTWLL